jgi:hypothetical protein
MPAVFMEWGGDLGVNPQGGLLLAYGADETRQAIIRTLLTTPANPPGAPSQQPEFYLDPAFGEGLRIQVSANLTPAILAAIKQSITKTVLSAPGVNPSIPPSIQVTSQGNVTFITVYYTLSNGQPSQMAFQIG